LEPVLDDRLSEDFEDGDAEDDVMGEDGVLLSAKGATAGSLYDVMLKRARELEPAAVSAEAALAAAWSHPEIAGLYRAYCTAEPDDPAPVAKSELPQSGAWTTIQQRATQLRAEQPALTQDAAITKVVEADPGLFAAYVAELG
jgi:hypothetical protein